MASLIFSWVDLEESGVISSLALVEKSLRPSSDMMMMMMDGGVEGLILLVDFRISLVDVDESNVNVVRL